MLTDVDAVYADLGTQAARPVCRASPDAMTARSFAARSLGPKVGVACRFVRANSGFVAIGALTDARAMLRGEAGTTVTRQAIQLEWGTAAPVGAAVGWGFDQASPASTVLGRLLAFSFLGRGAPTCPTGARDLEPGPVRLGRTSAGRLVLLGFIPAP